MGRKSYVSKKEEEADYEYQQYLDKKRKLQDEMSMLSKFNTAFLPVDGEPLKIYTERINAIVHQLDLQLQKHYTWYVHKSSPNCPICDALNVNYYILNLLKDLSDNTKQNYLCVKDKDMLGNLDWHFRAVTRDKRS